MGASGGGPLDNSDARDLLHDLLAGGGIDALRAALAVEDLDYLDISDASSAVAAAEVIAGALGFGSVDGYEDNLLDWLRSSGQQQVTDTDRRMAIAAVSRILEGSSELADEWNDGDQSPSREIVVDLRRRLEARVIHQLRSLRSVRASRPATPRPANEMLPEARLLWTRDAGMYRGMDANAESVFEAQSDRVEAIAFDSGELRWSVQVDGIESWAPVVSHKGVVNLGISGSDRIVGLDAATGASVDPSTSILPSIGHAYDPARLDFVRMYVPGNDVEGVPMSQIISANRLADALVVNDRQSGVLVVHAPSQALLLHEPLSGPAEFNGSHVVSGGNRAALVTADGRLHALLVTG